MTDTTVTTARQAIGALLNGSSPNGTQPNELGAYAECYGEMVRAHEAGGTEAARKVYVKYAEVDTAVAALRAADPEPPKREWSTADLLTTVFPEPKYAIPGLLPTGYGILAGRPKLGKSWLALQMAVAVGSGGSVFGQQVEQGRVLYLALEDNPRRIQDRLRKQQTTSAADINFVFEWMPLERDGTADLITAIDNDGYSLVIIDTISRALGRSDQMDLAEMNVIMGSLQRLAVDREIALLAVDHHRKSAGGAGDVIDDVMGSTSKAATADFAMGLYRERGQAGATLKVSGRDIMDQELALQWDTQFSCWQCTGTAVGVRAETVQADILDAMEEKGGAATCAAIAQWLGRDRSNVRKELLELVSKGVITRGDKEGREVKYHLVE